MADFGRILQLLDELREQIEQLQAETAPPAPRERAVSRALPPKPELPNVILPTLTDDPDSIVGGSPTRRGDFEDCCAVGSDGGYKCTGTLIAPNVVVTAKHCLNVNRVFLKGNDIDEPEEGETIKATAIPHPDHNVDLQVLVLERDSTVTPRRVATASEAAAAEECLLVGFGRVDLAGSVGYGIKRQVEVPITSIDCSDPDDQNDFGCKAGYEVVAGHRGLLKDTCRGDSGGPLYIRGEDGRYCLLAATSRGAKGYTHDCGDGGIYVRVDTFVDWIEEETGADLSGQET